MDWAELLGIGVGAGGEIAGGLASNKANIDFAREQMAWSAQQAQVNRDFVERMSSTAHQREVQDLIAAGLNPILSANAGAAGGTGFMPATPAVHMENPFRDFGELAVHSAKMFNEQDLLREEVLKTREETRAAKAAADVAEMQAKHRTSPFGSILDYIDMAMRSGGDKVLDVLKWFAGGRALSNARQVGRVVDWSKKIIHVR